MSTHTFRIGDVGVPSMALGTMYFGTTVPISDAYACLDAAYEAGARFWDTANNYAFWADGTGDESETTIGTWLTTRGASVRDDIVIATKIGARPRTPHAGLDDALGLSRTAIAGQVHASLDRLRTDHIDVLYAHIDDPSVPFEETLGALGDLLDAGTVRAIAASNLTPERLHLAMTTPAEHHYQALQQRFTYLTPTPGADLGPHVLIDDETSRMCDQHHLTRLGYAPLLSGAYTRDDRPYPDGYTPPERAIKVLHDVAAAHRLDAGQTVLAWMVHRTAPVIPVVGVSTPGQVEAAWSAVNTTLSVDENTRLDHARDTQTDGGR